MNIKALSAFRTVLTEGSIARASEKIHLSQSALSRLISGLEDELRLTLFHRKGRRLTPTPEGLAFSREAGRILDNLDEIRQIADEIREAQTERLRVITMPRIAPSLVSPAACRFIKDKPEVRLKIDVRTRRDAERWIVGSEYDIGIGALPVEHPEVETEVLLKVRAQAVLPANHPLSQKTEITAEDLAAEPVITLMPSLLLRSQAESFFQSAGISKSFICEVASSQLASQLVADGAGIFLADALTASIVGKEKIALVPLVPERWMSFGLLFPGKAELSESGKKFVEYIREGARALASDMVQPG